jgi:shikimate dehydrogenase
MTEPATTGHLPRITGRTRIYAHLGYPSGQVKTPQIFNAAFGERQLDVVAVPIEVTPENLPAAVAGLRGWQNLAGIGVTMPHKTAILRHIDATAGPAADINAVNCIRREAGGRLVGCNTDGIGFLLGMESAGHDWRGRSVLIVGLGGAGRALAFALAEAGAGSLTLANRTRSTAADVARALSAAYPAVAVAAGEPDPHGHDIIINATPLGMRPGDPLPIDASSIPAGALVADIITSPPYTPLLQQAQQRGNPVHTGLPMLTGQFDAVAGFLGLGQQEPAATSGEGVPAQRGSSA